MSEELATYDEASVLTVAAVVEQAASIQKLLKTVLVEGSHFGTIPGCGPKPTLLKPGAEKICLMFRLAPTYDVIQSELPGGHREYRTTCTLTHIVSGRVFGQGVGMASSQETKHRYREASRLCPACNQPAIIKGREEYGGGWVCFQKKGGCGVKFTDDAPEILNQPTGKVENQNPPDTFNTVLKMSKKRAQVDAVLTATAASDLLTQDLEDLVDNGVSTPTPPPAPKPNGSPQPEPNTPPVSDDNRKAWTTPFEREGTPKGTPLSKLSNEEVIWWGNYVKKGMDDPEKAKYRATNERSLRVLRAEMQSRMEADERPTVYREDGEDVV